MLEKVGVFTFLPLAEPMGTEVKKLFYSTITEAVFLLMTMMATPSKKSVARMSCKGSMQAALNERKKLVQQR